MESSLQVPVEGVTEQREERQEGFESEYSKLQGWATGYLRGFVPLSRPYTSGSARSDPRNRSTVTDSTNTNMSNFFAAIGSARESPARRTRAAEARKVVARVLRARIYGGQ